MGALWASFSKPTVPTAVSARDLINGDDIAMKQFRENYRELGFAVLEMDDTFLDITTRYRAICGEWFGQHTFAEKKKYVAESKDELFKELGRKPNIGYILTDHKKEYLKFKDSSTKDMFPNDDIYTAFKALFAQWHEAAVVCMKTVLSEQVKQPEQDNAAAAAKAEEEEQKLPEGMTVLTATEDRENIEKFSGIHSSISLIHYFNKRHDKEEEAKLEEDERLSNRTIEVPLGDHQDTGLMTLITCSDQYGLEMMDRKTKKYFYPEKLYNPNKHIFVIAGRKMELFTWKKVVKATWHAVNIPVEKERNSLLYFMEIQKDH